MGQSTEELRREIADTRNDLGTTVDAISQHVRPSRVAARQRDKLSSRWANVKDSVMGSTPDASRLKTSTSEAAERASHLPEAAVNRTQGHPVMAGAIAFGVGFLAAAIFPGTQPEGQMAQRLEDAVQPVAADLKQEGREAAEALREPARQAAGQLKDSATTAADHVRQAAQDAAHDSAAGEARDQVREQAKGSTQRFAG